MEKKYSGFLAAIILSLILAVLVLLYFRNKDHNITFSDYVTGDVIVEVKAPSYYFESEDEVWDTSKNGWYYIKREGYNTIGFIEDFYEAEMLMEPRKIAGRNAEEICVIIPSKGEKYVVTVNKFIQDHILCPVNIDTKQTIMIESEYCGENLYNKQQRIRYLQSTISKNANLKAYRMLVPVNFIDDNGQLEYLGAMTPEEIKNNCDLLMNEYLNEGKVGVYRYVVEEDETFTYVFLSYEISEGEVQILQICRNSYIINKRSGFVERETSYWMNQSDGWIRSMIGE